LIGEQVVDAVRFADGGSTLVVSTRSPATIYARLPGWIAEGRIRIHELRCADDSLHALFSSLMQIHRGNL
jgi:hypothetical protein